MSKKKVPIVVGIFFLVHVITSSHGFSAETWLLSPQTKVSLNESNIGFKQLYGAFCLAVSIYKSDAIAKQPKEELVRRYNSISLDSRIRFDFGNIDIGKKGWTRYYPFYIGDRCFIARIFLTEERSYQPKTSVLFEATLENPAVTFQILPGINEILKGCDIRPRNLCPPSQDQAATSL